MSQQAASDFDIVPTSTSGTELATLLNALNSALLSGRSGTSLPPSAEAGTIWRDTTSSVTHIVKYYNGTVSTELYSITVADGAITIPTEVVLDYADDNFLPLTGGALDGDLSMSTNGATELNIATTNATGITSIVSRDSSSILRGKLSFDMFGDSVSLTKYSTIGSAQGSLYFASDSSVTATAHFKAASLEATDGATGTFTTNDAKTVTVTNGIITAIV